MPYRIGPRCSRVLHSATSKSAMAPKTGSDCLHPPSTSLRYFAIGQVLRVVLSIAVRVTRPFTLFLNALPALPRTDIPCAADTPTTVSIIGRRRTGDETEVSEYPQCMSIACHPTTSSKSGSSIRLLMRHFSLPLFQALCCVGIADAHGPFHSEDETG